MLKASLRKKYLHLRKQISAEEVDERSIAIANKIIKLDIWNANYFHTFLSIVEHKEVDTDYVLNILQGKDKNIILSKSNFTNLSLTHYLLTDATLIKKNARNIPEPVDGIEVPTNKIEVVFIPLLAFDEAGNRVGYGKGFYDRFLEECNPNTIKIGLSFFEAEPEVTDLNPKDIPLDFCVTPNKVYHFQH